MSEVIKYSAIKLFGTTISLPPDKGFTAACHLQQQQSFSSSIASISRDYIKIDSEGELTGTKREDLATKPAAETLIEPATSADITDDPETLGKDSSSPKTRNTEEPSESDVSQEKTPKKPDKILPCPRCKSMDTKFCYFNNYNVNQPRHFCKLCKRYWTSGGTMRNVPVGSGRCKNRNASSSIYGHVIVQDTLQAAQASLKPIGSVLMFGSESPLCDPMTSPTLGKHSRDGNIILIDSNSFVLRANPAALSRSFNFRESV